MQKYNSHVMGITPFMFTTDFLSWSLKIKCSMRGQEVNWWCYRTEATLSSPLQKKTTFNLELIRLIELYVHTCASFIIMWAKTWRKPTIASHSLLWARDCWLPLHGPWNKRLCVIGKTAKASTLYKGLICSSVTWIYSVRLLKICFATVIALEKFFLPGSSMTSFPE